METIDLKDKKIVIASHVYTTGPSQDLRDFLIEQKTGKVLFIGHPLFYDIKLTGSGYEYYTNGNRVESFYRPIIKASKSYKYLKDIFLNLYYTLKFGKKWDVFVGSDNLNAFCGVILKWFGVVDKNVYYVIDYNPKRFDSHLLNYIYHLADRFCVNNCDEVWNLSPRMSEARKKYYALEGGNQIVVPVGVWLKRIKPNDLEHIQRHTLVYMGHVLKKQGIQYVIDALPEVIKLIPDFKFIIVGDGEYCVTLKKQIEDLNISQFIQFTGFVEEHKDLENILNTCGIAAALYEKYDENDNLTYTYFADPAKIKSYIAAGLPVLLTDVAYNAKDIQEKGCGKIITSDTHEISTAIISMMSDEDSYVKMRNNCLEFARTFDWDTIFTDRVNNWFEKH